MSEQDRIGCVGCENDCTCLYHRQSDLNGLAAEAVAWAFSDLIDHDDYVEAVEFTGRVQRGEEGRFAVRFDSTVVHRSQGANYIESASYKPSYG